MLLPDVGRCATEARISVPHAEAWVEVVAARHVGGAWMCHLAYHCRPPRGSACSAEGTCLLAACAWAWA